MFGLSKGCRTCCRKQQNKIQPASRKSKREFFRRENTKCTFSSRRHLCFRLGRQAAQSPTLPGRLHIPFRHQPAKISRLHSAAAAANPSIAKCFFLQLRFSRRENTRCIFFQHPKPSFPAWPANISRCQSYYNLQQDNLLPSGASRPTPPAALLFIPAHTILNQPTPISSHHFPNALHFFRPAAASQTRRPNAKRSFARGCSLQGCRWCGRGARVSFFSFFFYFFSASLFSLSFLISLAPRLRRDAFIFLFIFSFYFFSFFLLLFLFLFFLFVFLFLLLSSFFLFAFFSLFLF